MRKQKTLAARLLWVFKLLVLAVTLSYIYVELIRTGRYKELYEMLLHTGWFEAWLILLTLLLMVANWSLESRKWQLLMRHISRISFGRAMRAVFSGVTISTWMPNRIGEYIGRVFYLPPKARIKAIFSTIAGSLCQMAVTLIAGTIGLFMAWQNKSSFITNVAGSDSPVVIIIILGALVVVSLLYLLALFNIGMAVRLVPVSIKWKKLRQGLAILTRYDRKLMLSVLGISALRYVVFAMQFYLLLLVFQINVAMFPALALIAVIFLVQSVVPSIALSELGIRGAASIAILQVLTANTAGIFSASYSLWLVNIILPSLFGAVFILRARYRKEGTQRKLRKTAQQEVSITASERPASLSSK
ncbi:MAG: lysylphosphatidylglycerol synthase domain-containing protein [Bacteroidia bacterium]